MGISGKLLNGFIAWGMVVSWKIVLFKPKPMGLDFSIFLAVLAIMLTIIAFHDLYKGKRELDRHCDELDERIIQAARQMEWVHHRFEETANAARVPGPSPEEMLEIRSGWRGSVRASVARNPFLNRRQRREQIQAAMESDAREKFAYPKTPTPKKKKKIPRAMQTRADLIPDTDVIETDED